MQKHNNNGYNFTLNDHPFEVNDRFITGAGLRQICNIKNDDAIFLRIQGKDEEIHETEKVDLGREEIESFYTLPRHPVFKIKINKKPYDDLKERYITGTELRKLGHVSADEVLYLTIQGNDEKIEDDERVDLARKGVEDFYSKPDKPKDTVLLTIETTKGKWQKHPFSLKLTIAELIKLVISKYTFAADGNYQLKIKGGDALDPNKTVESYQFEDCAILCFTDLGKGA